MKLQQLKYIVEIEKQNLTISAAAKVLFTSQPSVSKQLRLFEDELGLQIFERSGKQLTDITEAGVKIIAYAKEVLSNIESINAITNEYTKPNQGALYIATTHTQARYALPNVIKNFTQKFPQVSLHIQQGTPQQISDAILKGEADFAIATEALHLYENLLVLPCYRWSRSIIMPKNHPLATANTITIHELSKEPLITYSFGFTGRSQLDKAFNNAECSANVLLTATDTDIIKAYVKQGMGVGVIASMALTKEDRSDFHIIDASELFGLSTTSIGIKKGAFLRDYTYELIFQFAPHLTRTIVEKALQTNDDKALKKLFSSFTLPIR